MKKTKRKNKFFLYIALLLYLVFYLFSPFFHYHHFDSIREEEKVDYHTHLLKDLEKKSNTTECHHTLDQNDEHDHTVVFNALIANLTPRFVYTLSSSLICFNIIAFEFQNESVEPIYSADFHFGKILKDKCVYFGSNASPPFILAA